MKVKNIIPLLLLLSIGCLTIDNVEYSVFIKIQLINLSEDDYSFTKVNAKLLDNNALIDETNVNIEKTSNENLNYFTELISSNNHNIHIKLDLYDNDKKVQNDSYHLGKLNDKIADTLNIMIISTSSLLKPIIRWNNNYGESIDEYLQIDMSTNIQTYSLQNIDSLVIAHLDNNLKYFYPLTVWGNLDSNDVPIVDYSFGSFRNPVTTAQTSFGFYDSYLISGEDRHKQSFLNNVNWLIDNCDNNYYLHYLFSWEHYGRAMDIGWISGMSQGQALASTSMAYFLTQEERYLNAANGFFSTLISNQGSEWNVCIDNNNYYWIEEYPNEDICHVLNGFLFSLWGLWDYYCVSQNELALKLFSAGIKTIVDNYFIWNYADENGSIYCLHSSQITNYHSIHVNEFEYYANLLNIVEFYDAVDFFSNE